MSKESAELAELTPIVSFTSPDACFANFVNQWAADDLIYRRVPLSRWSTEYKEEYREVSKAF